MRFIFLLSLLVVVSGCTGPSLPAGFTSYTLPETGIQLGYPSDWTVKQLSPTIAAFFSLPESESDLFLENVNVVTQEVPAGTTLGDYVQQQMAELTENSPTLQIAEVQATLAGSPGREISHTETNDGVTLRILQTITIKDTTAVVVTYTAAADAYDRYLPKARQITGTLQFGASSSSEPEVTASAEAPWAGSTAGLAGTWRVRGQQTSRVLELRAGGSWNYGTSRGTWSVQPITDSDWIFWQAEPYGPTSKMVLDNWDGGQATGPIEYSPDVPGRVDAFWLYNEKVILQFLHQ